MIHNHGHQLVHESLTQTSAPAVLLTTAEAKTHLHVTGTTSDTYIDTLVAAATGWAETFTCRGLVTQTWEWRLDDFPHGAGHFIVPNAPLSSVTSITYLDVDGVSQTLATSVYEVDGNSQPGRIALKFDQSWPSVRGGGVIDVATVTFVAGYGAASAVPPVFKHAVKMVIGHWFENRESVVVGVTASEVPQAAEMLLWSKRILDFS